MTPYLNRKLRSRHEVATEFLENMSDTYLPVCIQAGEFYFPDTEIGYSPSELVKAVASGEYPNLIAVLRIARDAKPENITEDIAQLVAERIVAEDKYEVEKGPRDCPFLDEVFPDWRRLARRVA